MKARTHPVSPAADGARIAVRVTPRAPSDAIAGVVADVHGRPMLAVRLAAPPVEGAANKALVALLARALDVPRSAVRIQAGESARLKIVHVTGVDAETVTRRLDCGSA